MSKNLFKIATVCFALIGSQLIFATNKAQASSNPALLIGEWSEPGMCSNLRQVYTNDGKVLIVEKSTGKWETAYEGVYTYDDRNLIIADQPDSGGFVAKIDRLTNSALKGVWLGSTEGDEKEEDEAFNYVKCQNR